MDCSTGFLCCLTYFWHSPPPPQPHVARWREALIALLPYISPRKLRREEGGRARQQEMHSVFSQFCHVLSQHQPSCEDSLLLEARQGLGDSMLSSPPALVQQWRAHVASCLAGRVAGTPGQSSERPLLDFPGFEGHIGGPPGAPILGLPGGSCVVGPGPGGPHLQPRSHPDEPAVLLGWWENLWVIAAPQPYS